MRAGNNVHTHQFSDTSGRRCTGVSGSFDSADVTSNTYYDWLIDHIPLVLAAQAIVVAFLETFKEFPPRQKAASFTIDQALKKMSEVGSGGR